MPTCSPKLIDANPATRACGYPYTQQLERLASKTQDPKTPLPNTLTDIVSPINISFWREQLQAHPDEQFIQLLLQGLENGFSIGFDLATQLSSARTNLISATEHPEVVSAYINEEHARGHIGLVGQLERAKQLDIHLSPLGTIPKKDRLGKWRLIMDLISQWL